MPVQTRQRSSSPSSVPVRAVAAALALLVLIPTALAGPLDGRVTALIGRSNLGNAQIGIAIVDIDSGQTLASRNADRSFIPASNMKLLTTGAAIATLGDQFAFRTELLIDDDRLVLRGSGDPALGDPEILGAGDPAMDVDELLARLVEAVRSRGPSRLREVVVDDRVFDRDFAHPTWPVDQLNRWYCAEVGGLNFHTNVLSVFTTPARGGANARPVLEVQPVAPWIEIDNRGRTVSTGQNTAWIARPAPANRFTLFGDVRFTSQLPIRVALHNPPLFTGRLLASRLSTAGVPVGDDDPIEAARLAHETEDFSGATPVVIVTTALTDVLRRCNADSHNLYAEALIKRIGHQVTGEPGTWANGAAVIRMLIADRLGPDHAADVRIADGSGMSRDNLVSPATMTAWLRSLAQDPEIRGPFLESLPQPGEGTLTRRFQGSGPANEVRAKSGTIRGVRCLSGYVIHPQTGRTVAFSVLLNDVPAGEPSLRARAFHEEVVALIDEWLTNKTEVEAFGG